LLLSEVSAYMPLSRHFYPLDDVHAALLHASCSSDPAKSVFWCQELLWSGCASEAISTLFESWLWQVGPFRLAWLCSAWNTLATEEITEDAIRLAAYQLGTLSASQRDHSLWQILVLGTRGTTAPDHITRKTPAELPSKDNKDIYFIRGLYQGKARCAWWMAQYLTPERVWELLTWYVDTIVTEECRSPYRACLTALQQYEQLLGYRSEEYDVVVRCVAVLMICLTPTQQVESTRPMIATMDRHVMSKLAEWSTLCGRKAARVYSLPTACLYETTWRGQHRWSQHNRFQLHHVEPSLIGCPFWNEAIAEYGIIAHGAIQWNSVQDEEAFYEQYFPDDIPDEWTMEEKRMSHGNGVLGPEEITSLRTYALRFLSLPSRLTWGCLHSVQTLLLQWPTLECHPTSITRVYLDSIHDRLYDVDNDVDAWLVPVHKMKCIAY